MRHGCRAPLTVLVVCLAAMVGGAVAQERRARPVASSARRRAEQDAGRDHASVTANLDCSACHTPAGWAMRGGAGTGRGFDHARTGFPLTGRHRRTECIGCHVPRRQIRRDCTACHRDAHDGRLGSGCDECHSATSWRRNATFERHRRTRLPLSGMHALIDCTECHERTTSREWSGVPAECFACHEDDYRRPDVHPRHDGGASGTPFPLDCSRCHVATAWSPAFVDPTELPARGALASVPEGHDARMPLSFGPHRGAPCGSCHTAGPESRQIRCTGCHAHQPVAMRRAHRRAVPADGAACLVCHPGGSAR
ncbi:MAG: hypothetical protein IT379_23160 [Deltaproteobacteria bacterium]|nr:hypothetical protein [Deltaproteobacteria bacterium]